MKKAFLIVVTVLLSSFCFAVSFKDSCNRVVEIPDNITKVAPSGAPASMIMESIAPQYLCCVNSKSTSVFVQNLPAVGNLYGGKNTINKEELLATGAQIIIEMGEYKKGIEEDLDALQKQLGIPCIFIEADIEHLAEGIRTLGSMLKVQQKAEEVASFIDKVVNRAKETSKKIKNKDVVSVLYTGNADGLGVNAKGSSNAKVLEIIGAKNAYKTKNVSNKFNGNQINMETLYSIDPDVIIFAPSSYYNSVKDDSAWIILKAVKDNRYYEVPSKPYNWMSSPCSLNMVLGIIWLGNVVYPQYFNYDVNSEIQEALRILWNITATD